MVLMIPFEISWTYFIVSPKAKSVAVDYYRQIKQVYATFIFLACTKIQFCYNFVIVFWVIGAKYPLRFIISIIIVTYNGLNTKVTHAPTEICKPNWVILLVVKYIFDF